MSETSKFNDPMDCLLYFDLSKAPQDNKLYRYLCKAHSLKNNKVIEFLSNEENLTEILEDIKKILFVPALRNHMITCLCEAITLPATQDSVLNIM